VVGRSGDSRGGVAVAIGYSITDRAWGCSSAAFIQHEGDAPLAMDFDLKL
jgi:hypothetical protein